MIHVVADKGYAEARIADVIAEAGISRKTYYELFTDKEECFLAAYDLAARRFLDAATTSYRDVDGPWIDRIRAAFGALFDALVADQASAKVCVVEVLSAGPKALTRRDAMIREITHLVDAGRSETKADLPGMASLAIVGGINELLYTEILHGSLSHLPARLPEVVYWIAQPFLGEQQADVERRRTSDWLVERPPVVAAA